MKLKENIRLLRKENALTQKELSKELNVGCTTITGYEKGTITPPPEKLEKMSAIFGVSVDFLLGKTDIRMLVKKNNQDIASEFENLISGLDTSGSLKLYGKELDDTTRRFLIQSLQNSLELAKNIFQY